MNAVIVGTDIYLGFTMSGYLSSSYPKRVVLFKFDTDATAPGFIKYNCWNVT